MITQIEIDGFKTFKDFKVELAPFQVIVGPNGSGKSNLFDALHLLSRLASFDLEHVIKDMRGDANELFTKLPGGESVDRMKFAVEMLVDRKVQDDFKKSVTVKYTRLRYELEIMLGVDIINLERLYVAHESLRSIQLSEDHWRNKYGLSTSNDWISNQQDDVVSFISTIGRTTNTAIPIGSEINEPIIYLFSDDESGANNQQISGSFQIHAASRTVLSSITNLTHFHAFAVRKELLSLNFLHLNPESLRQPSLTRGPRSLSPDGGNLPTVLARIQAEDKLAFHIISLDVANLVPGVLRIKVEQDKPSDKYVIYAETLDQRDFSAMVLSDGTLRLLALATLRNDPQFHGVLCLEEPENGVDPLHLKIMARLLRGMVTDFNDLEQTDEPLRQVLVTTHSPSFVSLPDVIDSLLVAFTPTHIEGKSATALRVTRMMPVATPTTLSRIKADINGDNAVAFYSIDQVRKYLDSETLEEAREQLEEARENLSQR